MQTELWRRIKAWPYEVSNEGRVRRLKDKRVLKPRPDGGGYMQVALHNKGARKSFQISRLVLEYFDRSPVGDEEGNHCNGDKSCNAWWNLEWLTPAQNATHAHRVLHRGARISIAIKQQILAAKAAGKTRREIAADMGILQRTVHTVVSGRQWAGVK
jgi:hypothetical protein